MTARAQRPFRYGPWTLAGLMATWWHSDSEELRAAAVELERITDAMEERIVKNFKAARKIEIDRGVFGCAVRDVPQLRKAIRRELEEQMP